MSGCRVAVVMSGFPRLSETFAINELLALQARGMLAGIFATKPGDPGASQPAARRLETHVEMLAGGSCAEQGLRLAARLATRHVGGIHAYFAHRPSEVAEAAARHLAVPFGFSVHARDARKVTPFDLRGRAARAVCVVACNPDVATDLARVGATPRVVPHGVDLSRFSPRPEPDGGPLTFLAVGRLVAKKGFDVLIQALSDLRQPACLRIVGDGPLRSTLALQVSALGLETRVTFVGALTHHDLPREYGRCHAVVVPSVVDDSGDRDGLPNVVLEAMASGRAVIGTHAGAIASAIRNEHSGLLVEPGSAAALARSMTLLASASRLREELGSRARREAEARFDLSRCANAFADVLEGAYA